MLINAEIAAKTAELLLQINAIKLNPQNPFTWTSGIVSPIYCDNRKTLSYPNIREFIKKNLSDCIKAKFPDVEVIAGVATAGIPHGALIADELGLPFIYVRSQAKEHGLKNNIEGKVDGGEKVVVVEDLISTGKSSLEAVDSLIDAECEILGMVAIFTYAFDETDARLRDYPCEYYTLSDYPSLLNVSKVMGNIDETVSSHLESWRRDPRNWKAPVNS